ncbi:peptidase, M4 (thermolysin) family [Cystobacter fuscus DSM 2262]|uniref:Neutral metalloproteinase n=1 Tax=Cystobacter fuscus (strain ATCC 25194 / DSM 2262 / NBRC 100088 / M29) TaxID=1242864 RepID=S9NU63_CYSF2|nr:M4 family metallopeptidase [Cystobacter fuscus]EPX55710.1 peptidase, M4 (thermolysin) family [Cystobacter fuscus DSM 2262]
MVRTRFLAAALLALPLAACEVDNSQLPDGAQKFDEAAESLGDVQASLAALPSARVVGAENDFPFMISGKLGTASSAVQGLAVRDAHSRVSGALPGIAAVFRLNASDLVAKRSRVDEQGVTHIRYGQMMNGLRVVNEELLLHVAPDGTITSANGTARGGEIVSSKPGISAEAAGFAAVNNTEGSHLSAGRAELVYVRSEGKLRLAYEVALKGEGRELPIDELTYVDAYQGTILRRDSKIHTALNRKLYSANNGSSTPGTLKRSEGQAAIGDTHVDQNYDKLGGTYDCYKNNFGRDSYNNAGATLISTVHYSTNYVNAYWNGTQMVYGDGNGVDSGMLGLSADVTTHELTHAVTSSESNLTYSGESGGLNEAMSDIFGAYCESYASGTWATTNAVFMVGDDIWTPATAGDALRYMYDPFKDGVSLDYWTSTAGSKDVHYSSGIANLAFTLLSRGGTHPRGKSTTVVPAIGVQKAGAIFYKANVDLMTPSTTFAQAKTYTEQAATALGYSTADVAAVTAAWTAVGVGASVPPPAATALTNGVAKTGLSGASGSSTYYYLDVPASRASTFVLSGGTGDADMYVKAGSTPTTSSYDCRPYLSGNNETCNITAKTAATRIYVMLNGYTSYSSTSLKGSYTP